MAEPLNVHIKLQDEQQGSAPSARDNAREYRRSQMASDRRRAYGQAAGGAGRGLTHTPIGSSDVLARTMEGMGVHAKHLGQSIPYVGATLVLAGAGMELAAGGSRRLDEMAERYGKYSPEVAAARADAFVKQTQFELEQAEKHGPALAKWVEAQANLTRSFEATQTETLLKGAPSLLKVMEESADALGKMDVLHPFDSLERIFPKLSQLLEGIAKFDPDHPLESLKRFGGKDAKPKTKEEKWDAQEKKREEEMKKERERGKNKGMDDFLDALKGAIAGGVPGKAANNAVDNWMAKNDQFELADVGMLINGVIEKEVGNPAMIRRAM